MGSSIGFYCGPADNNAIQRFAESIGLHLVPTSIDKPVNTVPELGPYCFLSLLPVSELHPYGEPCVRVTDARDPMIGFMRSYFKDPYLVAGHLNWSDDVSALAVKTKPYFQQLTKWIKQQWTLLPGGGFYVGPEGRTLVDRGAQMVNVLPGQAEFSRS
jgi:hypothetical protein